MRVPPTTHTLFWVSGSERAIGSNWWYRKEGIPSCGKKLGPGAIGEQVVLVGRIPEQVMVRVGLLAAHHGHLSKCR